VFYKLLEKEGKVKSQVGNTVSATKLVGLANIKVTKMIKVANFEAMIIMATDFDHCG